MWVLGGAHVHAPTVQELGKSPWLVQQGCMVSVPPVCTHRLSWLPSEPASAGPPPVPVVVVVVVVVVVPLDVSVVEVVLVVVPLDVVVFPPAPVCEPPAATVPPPLLHAAWNESAPAASARAKNAEVRVKVSSPGEESTLRRE